MSKFLDTDGLLYLWGKITAIKDSLNSKITTVQGKVTDNTTALGTKVDKVDGKGLSTNDFTDELKEKVENSIISVPATSWESIVGKPDVALKSDITSVYKVKGSVSTYTALPTEDNTTGDVYNVEDTGMNYVWTGTAWDALGSVFTIDAITNSEIDAIVDAET